MAGRLEVQSGVSGSQRSALGVSPFPRVRYVSAPYGPRQGLGPGAGLGGARAVQGRGRRYNAGNTATALVRSRALCAIHYPPALGAPPVPSLRRGT